MDKKKYASNISQKQIAQLLDSQPIHFVNQNELRWKNEKTSLAESRAQGLIRDELFLEACAELQNYCEILLVRLPGLDRTQEIPDDLVACLSTIVFAGSQICNELDAIAGILGAKYGQVWKKNCELNTFHQVNEKVLCCLSTRQIPLVDIHGRLEKIAKEYKVDWLPSSIAGIFEDLADSANNSNAMIQITNQDESCEPKTLTEVNDISNDWPSELKHVVPSLHQSAGVRDESKSKQYMCARTKQEKEIMDQNNLTSLKTLQMEGKKSEQDSYSQTLSEENVEVVNGHEDIPEPAVDSTLDHACNSKVIHTIDFTDKSQEPDSEKHLICMTNKVEKNPVFIGESHKSKAFKLDSVLKPPSDEDLVNRLKLLRM